MNLHKFVLQHSEQSRVANGIFSGDKRLLAAGSNDKRIITLDKIY